MLKNNLLFVCLAAVALLAFAATNAGAIIYLDEDFEGTVFVDQGWFYQDATTPADFPLLQGIQLRLYGAPADYDEWSGGMPDGYHDVSMTNTGTVTTSRFFDGAKCLRLASGQSLRPASFPWRRIDWTSVLQFAVSTNAETVGLAEGTEVGRFSIDYSTNGTDLTPEVTVAIKFVVNASAGVDIIVDNNDTTIGTLTGLAGNWHLITVVSDTQLNATGSASLPYAWQLYDEYVDVCYKGPQPLHPEVLPPGTPGYVMLDAGIYIYVDSNDEATSLSYTALGSSWGNSSTLVNYNTIRLTYETGWEIAAKNGGTLYIDDLYWDGSGHNVATQEATKEEAARIDDYAKATTEPEEGGPTPTPSPAGVKSWDLYF